MRFIRCSTVSISNPGLYWSRVFLVILYNVLRFRGTPLGYRELLVARYWSNKTKDGKLVGEHSHIVFFCEKCRRSLDKWKNMKFFLKIFFKSRLEKMFLINFVDIISFFMKNYKNIFFLLPVFTIWWNLHVFKWK